MASRILLADDSITIQKVVNLTFADEGIEVIAVSNGDQADRRLAEINPDLVLADIFMPGKNGYELCEAIKENPQFHNVPVVLLVGAFEPFDQAEAQRVKADAHLTKPFESRTLVETVRRLISANPRANSEPLVPANAHAGQDEALDDAGARSTAAAPRSAQFEGRLDLSAMTADSQMASSKPAVRNTGELASPAPDAQAQGVNFGFVDAPAEVVSATLTDTGQRFEPLEFSSNGDFSHPEPASSFELNMHEPLGPEMMQDFDTSQPFDGSVAQDTIPFEAGAGDLMPAADIRAEAPSEPFSTSGNIDTTREGAWAPPTDNSPLRYESPSYALPTEAAYGEAQASSDTAVATLLAVDEPLGDVLFDEAESISPMTSSELLAVDSLGLEFAEAQLAEGREPVSTQFDLVPLVEEPLVEAPSAAGETTAAVDLGVVAIEQDTVVLEDSAIPENSAAVVDATAAGDDHAAVESTFAVEGPGPAAEVTAVPAAVEQLTAEETKALGELDSVVGGSAADSHSASQESGDLDWTTPQAASYSTAQLDSIAMPADTADYLAENSTPEFSQHADRVDEATFNSATMWTEEEARFTPIDIEAVAVKDVAPEEMSEEATGFDFSAVPDEQPAASTESLVNGKAEEHSNGASSGLLSQAAIEEIVRRMVAEMSESVVREVAWEVVPDCVERVIEQLTREALSKRA